MHLLWPPIFAFMHAAWATGTGWVATAASAATLPVSARASAVMTPASPRRDFDIDVPPGGVVVPPLIGSAPVGMPYGSWDAWMRVAAGLSRANDGATASGRRVALALRPWRRPAGTTTRTSPAASAGG